MTDVALALDALVPAAEYGGSLTKNTQEEYEALRWLDKRQKPSWAQVQAVVVPDEMMPPPDLAERVAAIEERLKKLGV